MAERRDERWAVTAVCGVLGAHFEHMDAEGRQGAVDYLLRYSNGQSAAFEVTSHGVDGGLQLLAELRKTKFEWPNPGRRNWSISFEPDVRIKEVRQFYAEVIAVCEAHGVRSLEELPLNLLDETPLLRSIYLGERGIRFQGFDTYGEASSPVVVMPAAQAGVVDEELVGFSTAVTDLLRVPGIAQHVLKVLRQDADQHHLFIRLDDGALPLAQMYPLIGVPPTPPGNPDVPDGLSHLWLTTGYGPALMEWTREVGWTVHQPFSPADADRLESFR